MSVDTDVVIDEKISQKFKEPPKYKVILLNDDNTPMEWVIEILQLYFKHSRETAEKITLTIHTEGSGIAGIYSYEIAESKATEAVNASREHGFPLQMRVEEE
jgi:ATP-dependent Clp protease adaptor protein ClpS